MPFLRSAALGATLWASAAFPPQDPPHGPAPAHPAPSQAKAVPQKHPAQSPTHRPQLELPPRLALDTLQRGHAAWLQAHQKGLPAPAPLERPSGAGRYVVAVLACADCDADLAERLGLHRRDLFELRAPGPFVSPEDVAMLRRLVLQERLSLVVVLGHRRCEVLAPKRPVPKDDLLAARLQPIAALAQHQQQPLLTAFLHWQRRSLLAADDALRAAADADRLRVVTAELDTESGAIQWLLQPIDTLPMPPVAVPPPGK
ncbi:MAG: hypothetical protein JNK49_09440 [Planctomycetes bacterium]|nr:hypothetical protein [Planctomycetota bacterium]